MAVEVADSFQGRGIGTMLVALTIERARANGFRLLTATTLWENRAARALLRRYRFMAVESQGPQIDYELGVSG
jgi:ribosomal protein S18 acetylase RimI-like enzyme